jgi:hypothetical protein
MTQTYYKIQKKSDPDLYIKGTPVYHSYDKSGRVFQNIGALRTFLSNILNNTYRKADIDDWQIVEYEMKIRDTKQVHEVIKPEKIVKLLKNT